jgi:hypothetical protein
LQAVQPDAVAVNHLGIERCGAASHGPVVTTTYPWFGSGGSSCTNSRVPPLLLGFGS